MAEHINTTITLPGGHVWVWHSPVQAAKVLRSVGVQGAARYVVVNGERPGRVEGRMGGPAILKAAGANKAASDAALTALEDAIEALWLAGTAVAWEDDAGHTGTHLVITAFNRSGIRHYATGGVEVWQQYTMDVVELDGGAI